MRKWLQPTAPTPPGTPPGLPHIRTGAISCTVDHGGAKCPWDEQPASFHVEYSNGDPASALEPQGPGPNHDPKPGEIPDYWMCFRHRLDVRSLEDRELHGRRKLDEWQGPTTEEWVRRIGGKDVPWIR